MKNLSVFGTLGQHIDAATYNQMCEAMSDERIIRGALMPDAHLGYGLPIGGVIAVKDAISPYAVGYDIACRMRLTTYGHDDINIPKETLISVLEECTNFGTGGEMDKPFDHPVMDDPRWTLAESIGVDKGKAHRQLGTSGSGNHFAEFGHVKFWPDVDLGPRLALLTHSGSRGTGHQICVHFADIAKQASKAPLGFLGMDTPAGQDYFTLMNLMGDYASANHGIIHSRIQQSLGIMSSAIVENHHNFAWKEQVLNPETGQYEEAYVHRKGATPAGTGQYGIIPGTMIHPAYIVQGIGNENSINSASHGAGRSLSRSQAKKTLSEEDWQEELEVAGVHLISAGLDEAPQAYKNIDEVMRLQRILVHTVGTFQPLIVKMAGSTR